MPKRRNEIGVPDQQKFNAKKAIARGGGKASPASPPTYQVYITGNAFMVDGGWTAIDGPATGLTETTRA
jgi:hypothetical protein